MKSYFTVIILQNLGIRMLATEVGVRRLFDLKRLGIDFSARLTTQPSGSAFYNTGRQRHF